MAEDWTWWGMRVKKSHVKETYRRGAEYTEDGRDERIGTTEHAEGNGTRERGGKTERIT